MQRTRGIECQRVETQGRNAYSSCYSCSFRYNPHDNGAGHIVKNDTQATFMKWIFKLKNKTSKIYEIILKQSYGKKSAHKKRKQRRCLGSLIMTVLWGIFFIVGMEPFSSRTNTITMSSYSVDAFSLNSLSYRTLDSSHSFFSGVSIRRGHFNADGSRVLALRLRSATGGVDGAGVPNGVTVAATLPSPSMNTIQPSDRYPVLQRHDNLQKEHEQYPLPLLETHGNSNNNIHHLSLDPIDERIQHLLSDDKDEENEQVPDYSEQAANEVADKSVYSRISEQAKWKANLTMQNNQEEDFIGGTKNNKQAKNGVSNLRRPVRASSSKVTASVQETGGDSMSEYVKSMASHELLSPESEVLLGRHIQLLVQWETVRMDLERELNRQVFLFPLYMCFKPSLLLYMFLIVLFYVSWKSIGHDG
jgi:Sigma-70 factor, region 1.